MQIAHTCKLTVFLQQVTLKEKLHSNQLKISTKTTLIFFFNSRQIQGTSWTIVTTKQLYFRIQSLDCSVQFLGCKSLSPLGMVPYLQTKPLLICTNVLLICTNILSFVCVQNLVSTSNLKYKTNQNNIKNYSNKPSFQKLLDYNTIKNKNQQPNVVKNQHLATILLSNYCNKSERYHLFNFFVHTQNEIPQYSQAMSKKIILKFYVIIK
eukprot:TRINITY_DN22036_c0_g2_i1.p1 TRINITY_DN22036_c0_g2~~TRINITY_DN22036_c0_g2_i1.p1  ORF type:complete len:209 (+),score=-14.15 TRINITY_DN22036_c0_g2_i1:642-1268(+)